MCASFTARTVAGILVLLFTPDWYQLDVLNLSPSNPGFFLYTRNPLLSARLSGLDILRFYAFYLSARGFHAVVERIPFRKILFLASLVWMIFVVVAFVFGGLAQGR